MVPTLFRPNWTPPIGGVVAGVAAAAALAALPQGALDRLVDLVELSGARPPRWPMATGGGLFAGAMGWAALFLLFGRGGPFARRGGGEGLPKIRRADGHPDAPPRRPLCLEDLGPPPERELPLDLDQPLAAYDPGAIPARPLEPARAVTPLIRRPAPLGPGERIDTFEIRREGEGGSGSIDALLAKLEDRTMRRHRLRGAN